MTLEQFCTTCSLMSIILAGLLIGSRSNPKDYYAALPPVATAIMFLSMKKSKPWMDHRQTDAQNTQHEQDSKTP